MLRFAVALALVASVPGWAREDIAEVTEVNGSALVNQQRDTVAATLKMPLYRGDSVLTRDRSDVLITYDNNCRIRLPSNLKLDIEAGAACCITDDDDADRANRREPIAILHEVKKDVSHIRSEVEGKASNEMELFAGDIVHAKADSSAIIEYLDGCDIKIENDTRITVQFAEECCLGLVAVNSGGALGTGAPTTVTSVTPPPTTVPPGVISGIIIGGGIIGGIIIDSGDGDEVVVSPE